MNFYDYLDKRLLCWTTYNRDYGGPNRIVYAYPRVIITKSGGIPVDEADFPTKGAFEMHISNYDLDEGRDAAWYCDEFGPISIVTIQNMKGVEARDDRNNRYRMFLRQDRVMGASIEKAGSPEVHEIVDTSRHLDIHGDDRQIDAFRPYLPTVMVRSGVGDFSGPFGVERVPGAPSRLHGVQPFDYHVATYDGISDSYVWPMRDEMGHLVCSVLLGGSLPDPQDMADNEDWIPDARLVDIYAKGLAKSGPRGIAEMRIFQKLAAELVEEGVRDDLTEERLGKLERVVGSVLEDQRMVSTVTSSLLARPESLERIVEEAAKSHSAVLRDELRLASQRRIAELEAEVDSLRRRNVQLEAARARLLDPEKLPEDIARLTRQRDQLSEQVAQEKEELGKIGEQLEGCIERFSQEADRLAGAADSVLMRRLLRGKEGEGVPTASSVPTRFDMTLLRKPAQAQEIMGQVAEYVTEYAHRPFSENDAANVLICLSQGFITTFAGNPGTGKTSMCRIIARSLGLARDDDQNRFVDVSVERGWNSVKDFIGYYNPLMRAFEKSNAEVFDAFARMDQECGSEREPYLDSCVAPFLVLLDEANLSPIEHYWSAFLKNCDLSDTSSRRTISLGGDRTLRIAPHLRFLATVNSDYTTEELSPRFVDRSWIITLMPRDVSARKEEAGPLPAMVSYADLTNAFAYREGDRMDDAVAGKWERVRAAFWDCSLPISPRNLRMVEEYCAAACRTMNRAVSATELAPLDYAVAQKVLPTINGAGEQHRRLVEKLGEICTEDLMPNSAYHLDRMRKGVEENAGFTQFFSH